MTRASEELHVSRRTISGQLRKPEQFLVSLGWYEPPRPHRPERAPRPGWRSARSSASEGGREPA